MLKKTKGMRNKHSRLFLNLIIIALIDDGVDRRHQDLCGDNFLEKSFDAIQEDGQRFNSILVFIARPCNLIVKPMRHVCLSAVIMSLLIYDTLLERIQYWHSNQSRRYKIWEIGDFKTFIFNLTYCYSFLVRNISLYAKSPNFFYLQT